MGSEKPELSIIIVNWNTKDLLRKCLRSIYETVPPIGFQAMVVDNASSDGSAEMVETDFPEAVVIRSDRNLGFSGGNNLGLAKARGNYLMLLNSDAELLPESASGMIQFMRNNPEAGMVGPKLVSPDGALQINGQKFPTFFREVMGLLRIHRLIPSVGKAGWGREDFDVNSEVDALAGACMLVRREIVETVGKLDDKFFMYYEDVDWCYRIKKAGWKIFYLGEAEIVHAWAESAKKQGIVKSNGILYKSQYHYFRKHHGLLPALALRVLSSAVQTAFAIRHRRLRREAGL